MSWPAVNSSASEMTWTSEVVLSIEMVSLPVGGMITRIACGSTIRRSVAARLMPSAWAASVWPSSTDWMPPRTISAMYAASLRPRPSRAAVKVGIRVLVDSDQNSGPNGMPIDRFGHRAPRKFQNTSCTSTGVPRKIQM